MHFIFSILFILLSSPIWAASQLPSCKKIWQQQDISPHYDFYRYSTKSHQLSLEDITPNNYVELPSSDVEGNFSYPFYMEDLGKAQRANCQKELTILVYMAANNNLSPYAFWDLTEMEASYADVGQAGSTSRVDLLVDFQSYENQDLRRLHMFQSYVDYDKTLGIEHYEAMGFNNIMSPIAYYSPHRIGTVEEQFFDFLQWGIKNYPSERYMVVVWGHGQGFTSVQREEVDHDSYLYEGRFGGLAFQEGSNDYLTTPALARVLKKVKDDVFDGQDQIDIYASDACLMQMLEVAYEISPYTHYIVGSAQIQSYLGMPYRTILNSINRGNYAFKKDIRESKCNPETTDDVMSCNIAHMIPELTRRTVHPKWGLQGIADENAYKKFTVSSLRSSIIEEHLAKYMDVFGRTMYRFLNVNNQQVAAQIESALKKSLRFVGNGIEITTAMILLNRELSKYMKNLSPDDSNYRQKEEYAKRLIDLNRGMLQELNELSIASESGEFYKIYLKFAGPELGVSKIASIALWIPKTKEQLNKRLPDFRNSRLYKSLKKIPGSDQTYWEAWLRKVIVSD